MCVALLLASLDASSALVSSEEGQELINETVVAANYFRDQIRLKVATTSARLLDDYQPLKELNLLVDPLRLTVRFERRNAIDVDDTMCEGMSTISL